MACQAINITIMITFKQFLIESRSAPLYHGTIAPRAVQIIRSNVLLPYADTYGAKDKSISFTRMEKYAKEHPEFNSGASLDEIVVFEVDQAKLINNYKLKPHNYFNAKTRYLNKPTMGDLEGWNEYEERIMNRSIQNFDKYIKKIIVYVKPGKPISDNPILSHPKLYYNGRFVNK